MEEMHSASGAERLKAAQQHQKKHKATHSKHNKTKRKKHVKIAIVSVLCSFLVTMFLSVILLATALRFGFFNKGMTLDQINASGYYTKVYEELIKNLETIVESKSLPSTVVSEVFTEKKVYINGKQYIENSLNNIDTDIDTKKINDALQTAIKSSYEQRGITVTSEVQSSIDATINELDTEYTRMTRFQFVNYIRQYKNQIYDVFRWLLPILGVLSLLLCFVMIKIQRYAHRGVRYIAMAVISAGLLNIIVPVYLLVKKSYAELGVTPSYYATFLSDYFHLSLNAFLYTGIASILVGFVLVCVKQILKNKIK